MQNEENEIRRMAKLYMEGKIPLKDERILLEFISNDANRGKYAQWEKEWRESNDKNPEINRKWELLQNRIFVRENISNKPIFKPSISLWRKLSVAAAIALLIITTAISVHELTIRSDRDIFTAETPCGGKSKIHLPDGSTVWINAGSQIKYNGQFNVRDRVISLTGEAYFEVEKQTGKPFIVKLRDYDIEVTGTKFNVSSYEDEKQVITTLMEGVIRLRYNNEEFVMNPGETMLFDVREKTLRLQRSNTAQYCSWTEGRIEYDEITLEELFNRLSRQYNVHIHANPAVDINKTLSVSFNNNETIDEIFYGISKVASIKYKHKNEDIYVSKK
ncbi:MAG: FecR family protein [Dysgonamonadaceae bacterium]|jgi:ferric-dicitrate binding protein FerR (iron transport regulator)|nr:FecR family protein [Dysgonamonadaceae bacterium]